MRLVPRIKRSCCCCCCCPLSARLPFSDYTLTTFSSSAASIAPCICAHVVCVLCTSHFLVMLLVRWARRRFLPHFLGNFGGSRRRTQRPCSVFIMVAWIFCVCRFTPHFDHGYVALTVSQPAFGHSCLSRDGLRVDL
jgi:hypothetical protein